MVISATLRSLSMHVPIAGTPPSTKFTRHSKRITMGTRFFGLAHHRSTAPRRRLAIEAEGFAYGILGTVIFSATLPCTHLAVAELDPTFVAMIRAVIAALCAALYLALTKAPKPSPKQARQLVITALGVVLGFPLLTSIAMRDLPASHGAIVAGVLPLSTAVCALLIAHERPSKAFWCCALVGSALVVAFALRQGAGRLQPGDWAMIAAVVSAGIGYAQGAVLSQDLGGARVISWALIVSLPIMLPGAAYFGWHDAAAVHTASHRAWLGLCYISVTSMFFGFFAWYRGLALGGVARVGQVQLLQPFLTLFVATGLLGEKQNLETLTFAFLVVGVVALSRRFSVAPRLAARSGAL